MSVLLYIYLSSMIVGGVLLLTSVLFGGDHDSDMDTDLDHDFDVDHDVDMDVDHDIDVDHDLDTDHDLDGDSDADAHVSAESTMWLPFFSLRFWVFFTTFFGLTGTVLDVITDTGKMTTLGLSILIGFITGFAAAYTIQVLKRTKTGVAFSVEQLAGHEGTVYLPLTHELKGKVKIDMGDHSREVIALNLEQGELCRGEKVLIVKYEDNVAYVTNSQKLLHKEV